MKIARCFFLLIPAIAISDTASQAQAQQRFTDVTQSSGVVNALLGTSGTWADYDGDGLLDLYVTNWATGVSDPRNALFRNDGNGRFTNVAGQSGVVPLGVNSIFSAWGDYDNDGDADLYVVNFFRANILYRNQAGRFTDVTGAAGVAGGPLGTKISAAWGDYDGDGSLDLYLCKGRVENELYRNNGDGTFSLVDAGVEDKRDSEKAAWVDYDDDGDVDLYVVNREQANGLYRNDGSGTFEDVGPIVGMDNTEVGRNLAWTDYDNDGDMDCFLANIGANVLYRNEGAGSFVNVSKASGVRKAASGWISWTGIWGDFNHDGHPDIFVAQGVESANGEPDVLYVAQGDGTFLEQSDGSGVEASGYSMNAATADFDDDGDLDLFVVHDKFPGFEISRLFRNDQDDENFIKVKIAGSGPPLSNRDGVGAKVRLLAAGTQNLRGVRFTTSGPQPLSEVHFGVAPGSYDVEVRFPSGRTVKQEGITQGQTVIVQEGN